MADFKKIKSKSTHWKVTLWIGLDGFCWYSFLYGFLPLTRDALGWKSRIGTDSVMDGYGWTNYSCLVISSVDVFFLCCDFFPWGGRGQCVWFQLFLRAILLTAAQKSERNFVTRNAHICSAVHGCLKLEVACHVSTSHKKNDYHIPYWQNKISSISIGKVQVTFQVFSVSSRHCFASEANQYDHYHHQ